MDSEQEHIRRFLYLDEIAHIVLENKPAVLRALQKTNINFVNEDDEVIVQLVYDNRNNAELNNYILKLLSENPYRRSCHSCWEKVSDTVEKVKNKKS